MTLFFTPCTCSISPHSVLKHAGLYESLGSANFFRVELKTA